jgi:hypothetical protein
MASGRVATGCVGAHVVVAAMNRDEVTLCILALSIKSYYSNIYLSITYIRKISSKPPWFVYFQKSIIVPYLSMRFVFYLTLSVAVRYEVRRLSYFLKALRKKRQ